MRPRALIVLGGLMLAGGAPSPAAAQDVEAGRQVAGMCRTCHGMDGHAQIPVAPHIGGEPAGYLASQLRAFRSGERVHEMMSVVAASLSDEQIEDVSAWYASHAASASLSADPSGAPELCSGCHGADGIAVVEDAPNLAGEVNIYLAEQLKAFRSGARTHEAMNEVAADLSDDEIRALADWYGDATLTIEAPAAGG